MGEGLRGEPNEYTAGLDFDYSVWSAGTQIDLVNVTWDNNYDNAPFLGGTSNTVTAEQRKKALNNYIDGLAPAGIRITNTTYVKPGEDVILPVPYNRINRYNYLRASNPLMPIPGDIQKDYYYFILNAEMVNPTATRLRLQLDVFQTYAYDVEFGNCYVERGHIGIANENQMDNYGRDYLTVPEGFDIGADYRIIHRRSDEIIGYNGLTSEIDILVFSTNDLLADPGTLENPNNTIGPGSNINGLPSAATAYVFPNFSQFTAWLSSMQDYSWVTQGVISVNPIPKLDRYQEGFTFDYNPVGPTRIVNFWAYPRKHKFFTNWRNSSTILNAIPAEFRHLKKFLTAPYMVIELTTWSATPVVLRPEEWKNPDAFVLERANLMPPAQRIQFTPRQYNSNGQAIEPYLGVTYSDLVDLGGSEFADTIWPLFSEAGEDYGDYLDVMTQVGDFPSLPIINNMAISYLASNAHSISYQRQSAEWSQTRAMTNADRDFANVSTQMETAQSLADMANIGATGQTAITNKNAAEQAGFAALERILGGGANGVGMGGFGGRLGVSGVASGVAQSIASGLATQAQMTNTSASTELSNMSRQADTAIQNRGTGLIRDTNRRIADYSARGDYANQIAGINARVQDAAMIQPSIAGQFGGDAANLAHGTMEISVRWKLIDNAAIKVIGQYWLRFGYAVRAFIKPPKSLMVMENFTYWKMTQANIKSATVPEGHKQALRGIMEKGVTVHADPSTIGDINLNDNAPLTGISY